MSVWTDDPITSTTRVRTVHINELRSTVTSARAAAGLSSIAWTDGTITVGAHVRAVHFTELQSAIQDLWTNAGMGTLPNWSVGSAPSSSRHISARDIGDLENWVNQYETHVGTVFGPLLIAHKGIGWGLDRSNTPNDSSSQYDAGDFTSALILSDGGDPSTDYPIVEQNIYWIETAVHSCSAQPAMSERVVVRLYYPKCSTLPLTNVGSFINGGTGSGAGRWDPIIQWCLGQGVTDFVLLNELDIEYGPYCATAGGGNCSSCPQYAYGQLADFMLALANAFHASYKNYTLPNHVHGQAGFPGASQYSVISASRNNQFWTDTTGSGAGNSLSSVAQNSYDWVGVHIYPTDPDALASLEAWTSILCNDVFYNRVPSKYQWITEFGVDRSSGQPWAGLSDSQLGQIYAEYARWVRHGFPFVHATYPFVAAKSTAYESGTSAYYEMSNTVIDAIASGDPSSPPAPCY